MARKENTQVAGKWIEALNAHDVRQLEKYRAPGYLFRAPHFPGPVGASEETRTPQRVTVDIYGQVNDDRVEGESDLLERGGLRVEQHRQH